MKEAPQGRLFSYYALIKSKGNENFTYSNNIHDIYR